MDKFNQILGILTAEQKWTSEIKNSILIELRKLYVGRLEDIETKEIPGKSNSNSNTSSKRTVSDNKA